jgi:hypothetical protein
LETGRWTEGNREVHELFCKRIMGMPSMTENGVCVRGNWEEQMRRKK